MSTVVVALDGVRGRSLTAELETEGLRVLRATREEDLPSLLSGADAIVVPATRDKLTADLVAACDHAAVRIVALGGADSRLLARFGLVDRLPDDAAGWQVAAAIRSNAAPAPRPDGPAPRVTAVWGPHGSPGRSTLAILLAIELTRLGRRTALVDADTVAPSLALLLGLGDEAAGLAAACRRAELGGLDPAELTRLAASVDSSAGTLDVLVGINRPARWPEISGDRITACLQVCRTWAEETVVDVAGEADADEEVTYDVLGPRRHAATTAVLREADAVIAVASADPLGISRFLREQAEVRRIVAPTPLTVVVNQVRPGPLGLDARGQIRRTLERFAGITEVLFLPHDPRAADAALLHSRPMADLVPRSPLVAGARELAASMAAPEPSVSSAGSSRGSSRVARLLRSTRAVRGG